MAEENGGYPHSNRGRYEGDYGGTISFHTHHGEGGSMTAKAKELTALAVQMMRKPGMHFVGGVSGLALNVLKTGGRTWVLRAMIGGKRRDMGLGGYPDLSLAEAREAARAARAKIREGIDPIDERKAARIALYAAQGKLKTFEECAEEFVSTHETAWKNPKHRQQWRNTLANYVYPKIGRLAVQDVGLTHVMAILEPIWQTKTETAKRVRGRLEDVLDWAITREYRSGPNPAQWRGYLDKLLPSPGKVGKRKHFAALPFAEMGAFMARLRTMDGVGARALEFAILTAARSGEVRGATWAEIDLEGRVWTIPAERMKAGKEHRVPLSGAAIALLAALPHMAGTDLVFASSKGTPLSDMTLTALLRRMEAKATAHGFRSTFRDWASELTDYPHDVCEMALAHTVESKVEAAYRRGDLFERRKAMMTDWAAFCAKTESAAIIPIMREKGEAVRSGKN